MQQAINFYVYGLKQLFDNLPTALRLTAVVWVGASVLVLILGALLVGQPVSGGDVRPDAEGQMPALTATFTMLSLVINVMAAAWVSLIWSRFCLGADTPRGVVPSLKGLPFSNFLITVLLVVVVVGGAGLILNVLENMVIMHLPLLVSMIALPLISTFLMTWLLLRVGAALPATAAGQVLSLVQAWVGARDKSIWVLAILAVVTTILLVLPSMLLAGLMGANMLLHSLIGVVTSWLLILIGTGWLVAIFRSIPPMPK